jgi:hypothetical protein
LSSSRFGEIELIRLRVGMFDLRFQFSTSIRFLVSSIISFSSIARAQTPKQKRLQLMILMIIKYRILESFSSKRQKPDRKFKNEFRSITFW